MRHGLSTAEAALGRVDRVGVGEHDEEVADRQVSPIARYREKSSNLPLRKAEEPSASGIAAAILYMYLYKPNPKFILQAPGGVLQTEKYLYGQYTGSGDLPPAQCGR